MAKRKKIDESCGRLITIAANLHTYKLSVYPEDWPKTTPKTVLKTIERHNEFLRKIAIELRQISENIKPFSTSIFD